MGSGRFEGDRKDAWVGMLHVHAQTMSQLGRELDDAGKIPLSTYDILVQLTENGGLLRLRDLVNLVLLSQPGLSRKVARLEEEGLVERLPDPNDGRGVLVRMTRAGRAALRSAAVVHIAGIEREFTSKLTDVEAETLAGVFTRLQNDRAAEPGSLPEQGKGARTVARSAARPNRRSLPSGSAAGGRRQRRAAED
jgi:DNA-binding MarR family transcriptional regulator